MLFHRDVEPDEEGIRFYAPEEETTTPKSLFGIGLFAAFGFLVMAERSPAETRGVPLFVGGLIIGLLALTAGFLLWQRRYGESTLKANAPFAFGQRFEGWIETEMTSVPAGPVRVMIEGREGKWIPLHVAQRVTPAKRANGTVRVPFSLPIPDDETARRASSVRLMVRTRTWPVGWGATFVVSE